jgi:hypothetical protein
MARLLIDARADPSVRDADGRTVMDRIARHMDRETEMLRLLRASYRPR